MKNFNFLKTSLVFCALLPLCAVADYDKAIKAYDNKDYKTASEEFAPRAMLGDPHSQFYYGMMHYHGYGMEKDPWGAARWLRKAAEQNFVIAQLTLGLIYSEESEITNLKEAAKWFRRAADKGDATAQSRLAGMYYQGKSVPQDHMEAAKLFRLAADQGNVNAQSNLGTMYYKGEGLPQDYMEAAKLFRLAADQGNTSAQFNLGTIYATGEGVSQDYREAAKWFRLAADKGFIAAQSSLGFMYQFGHGVTKNKVIAYSLYNVSATEVESTESIKKLSNEMSSKEIDAGKLLTSEMMKPNNVLIALDRYEKGNKKKK